MLQVEHDEMKLKNHLEDLKNGSSAPRYSNLSSEMGSPSYPNSGSKTFKMNGQFYKIANQELKSILQNFGGMKMIQD